jgi:hypothetical protein
MSGSRAGLQIGVAYWLGDQGLRRCTHEERGVWLEVMCLMQQSQERGVLRWPLVELAEAVKSPVSVLETLVLKGVMGGRSSTSLPNDELYACSQMPFVYTPRHSGRLGEPVILMDEVAGDVWFAPEMLIEEHKRRRQMQSSVFRRLEQPSTSKEASTVTDRYGSAKAVGSRRVPDCPYAEVTEAFMDMIPAARKVRLVTPESGLGKSLKARWRAAAVAPEGVYTGYETAEEGVRKWRELFAFITESRFLMGKVGGHRGRPPFQITLAWLVGPENFDKVVNGFYHREAGTAVASAEAFAETVMGTTATVMSIVRGRASKAVEQQGSLL